jgi:hypothetical protein
MLYNYQPNNFISFPASQTALIAYNIAGTSTTPSFLSTLSNAFTTQRVITSGPFSVFTSVGNYGKIARSVFDVSFAGPVDPCLNWYNSLATKNIKSALSAAVTKEKYLF